MFERMVSFSLDSLISYIIFRLQRWINMEFAYETICRPGMKSVVGVS